MENKIISLPYGIVDLAIDRGWSKDLAYYCNIAMLFSNKLIYSYSSRKLAVLLNVSHGTVNTHVKSLINKKLLSLDNGNLRCASISQLKEIVVENKDGEDRKTGKGLLKIKVHNNILNTEWNILARVVLNSVKKQKYKIKKKNEVNVISRKVGDNVRLTKKEVSVYLNNRSTTSDKMLDVKIDDKCMLSDNSIALLLKGRSVSSVRQMVKFWVNQGLISNTFIKGRTLETHTSLLSHSYMKEVDSRYTSTYLYKGRVIEFNKRVIELGKAIKPFINHYKSNEKYKPINKRELENIAIHYKVELRKGI